MIPLGAGDIPTSSDDVATRVAAAIGSIINSSGRVRPEVDCVMSSPDRIQTLSVDLTSMESAESKTERPTSLTQLGGVVVDNMTVGGDPIVLHGAPVTLKISGKNLPMTWSRDDRGNLWLVPADERGGEGNASGDFMLAAPIAQIEQAARKIVGDLAVANGAKLKDLKIRVESAGPRSLAVRADIAAAKFMMTAKVQAVAEVSLDDNMNLNIGNLDVTGDGAAGTMVANMLADKLTAFRGRQIALGQYMFAGAALEDVRLEVDDRIRVTARFGKSGGEA